MTVAAVVSALPGRAAAQGLADVTRPCKPADLIGAWEVVRFGTVPSLQVDRTDPAFYPNQRYVFARDATVRHLASQTEITPASHRELLAAATPGTWAVDAEGHLLLLRDGRAKLEQSQCLVLTKEVVDSKKRLESLPGDVLLTDYDAAGQPVIRRELRKLVGLDE